MPIDPVAAVEAAAKGVVWIGAKACGTVRGHVPSEHGTSEQAAGNVAKAALKTIPAATLLEVLFFSIHIVSGLFVGVREVLGIGDELLAVSEIKLIIFEVGRALHETATTCRGKGRHERQQRNEIRVKWGGRVHVHVPWFKVLHSVILA